MGCDVNLPRLLVNYRRFNSRTPCGVRLLDNLFAITSNKFQFTHPVWGATIVQIAIVIDKQVSIHAPRVGCDSSMLRIDLSTESFQFTHPVWGATMDATLQAVNYIVSIHAPRVGCDYSLDHEVRSSFGFNSRTPCGVRLPCGTCYACQSNVSIHAPRVGCDHYTDTLWCCLSVSIHAPRVGCDFNEPTTSLFRVGFNSRTPCGVRLKNGRPDHQTGMFQFTHPVWGATLSITIAISTMLVSIHAPRVGCDRSR